MVWEQSSRKKIVLAVFEFDGDQLALENLNKKVAATAGRFQKAGIDAFGLGFHEVEHCLDHPRRGKDFPVVGYAIFGLNEAHRITAFCAYFCCCMSNRVRLIPTTAKKLAIRRPALLVKWRISTVWGTVSIRGVCSALAAILSLSGV
jgi:hypothetical protein